MAEEVINYSGSNELNWYQRKRKGFLNRYYKYKRLLLWAIHIRKHNIAPDYSKIPSSSTPVIINNFNRLDLLKKQIDWLLSLDDEVSIIIVDNFSTYPPLLAYYKAIKHPSIQVVPLNFNSWRKGAEHVGYQLLKKFKHIVITDSDLLPYQDTPLDIIAHLRKMMIKYPNQNHIGTSLEIDDLPDFNPMKSTVINYEQIFWPPKAVRVGKDGFEGLIDTTFAMYRKNSRILATGPAMRCDRPYTLQHLDWYLNPNKISAEYQYYFNSCKTFATWAHEQKRKDASLELPNEKKAEIETNKSKLTL